MSDYYNEQEEVKLHNLLNDQFFSIVEDDHLDLVYIDGDRSFEGSYKDLVNAHKIIKNGQFIMEHNYHQDFSGILDSINESCKNYNLKIKHLTDHELPSYLIVNRK